MKYEIKLNSGRSIFVGAKYYITQKIDIYYHSSTMSILQAMQKYLNENESDTHIELIDGGNIWICTIINNPHNGYITEQVATYKLPWQAVNECIAQWFYNKANDE